MKKVIDKLRPLAAAVWARKCARRALIAAGVALVGYGAFAYGYPAFFRWYTGDVVATAEYPSSRPVSDGEFEELSRQVLTAAMQPLAEAAAINVADPATREDRVRLRLRTESFVGQARFRHIDIFRKNGIRRYDGPETCLKCHATMRVQTDHGYATVDTMDDVLNTVHFKLFSNQAGFSTYGYNGKRVNAGWRTIPVGKIDRACGIPGSFTWTGWADLIAAKPKGRAPELVSAGCGQCHVGGMYGPPSEAMMPGLSTPKESQHAVDCLICHSATYDMNQKYVVDDGHGKRWNQDRSLQAAMAVTKPRAEMCLRCHQHNLGGDSYEGNDAAHHLGDTHPRIIHSTSKRATPFGADWDVHARAGVDCLDCHTARGHKIARGNLGTDLVANDLPGVDVSCERCHTSAPHLRDKKTRAILNGHVARLACETCHITKLHPSNLVLVDWINPVYNEDEGIWTPRAVKQSGDLRQAVQYLWFNGNGTFLANALGSNPNGPSSFNPLMNQLARYTADPAINLGLPGNSFTSQLSPEMLERRKEIIAQALAPVANAGTSKIYPFKVFNARMFEDMNNSGPFGAMILPFDYKVYHETGKPWDAMVKAVQHPIVRRMYQWMFKYYMMDDFMAYFGVGKWTTKYPLDSDNQKKIEPHWMRQMGSLMVNHAISEKGLECRACHVKQGGLMDFRALGYTEERTKELQDPPELREYGLDQGSSE